eukprot:251608-Prymnesium_polylepis.2
MRVAAIFLAALACRCRWAAAWNLGDPTVEFTAEWQQGFALVQRHPRLLAFCPHPKSCTLCD